MSVVALLLCGGRGTRFGGDKLVAGDPPIAVRAARNLQSAGLRILAVVPTGAAALISLLEREGCEVLPTDRTTRGMGASLAAGVEATASASGWIIALGDMPAVAPETITAVRDALGSDAAIAVPVDPEGRRGHPVGFTAQFRPELLALDGDQGARAVLQRHAKAVHPVEVRDQGIFLDVDTASDLEALDEDRRQERPPPDRRA